MKIVLLSLCTLLSLNTTAQNPVQQDSLGTGEEMKIIRPRAENQSKEPSILIITDSTAKTKTGRSSEIIIFGKGIYGKNGSSDISGTNKQMKTEKARYIGIWPGFNYGFVNLAGDREFMNLNWKNSFSMQFNFLNQTLNICRSNRFGLMTGLGLEYQRLVFDDKNISITTENRKIVPIDLSSLNAAYIRRSTLKNLYLNIPLFMQVQFPSKTRHTRVFLSGGFMGGIRLHSKTKVVYRNSEGDKSKKKDSDDFYILPVKADAFGQIGYGHLNIWGSYTLTHLFRSEKGPKVHPYKIGIGITF